MTGIIRNYLFILLAAFATTASAFTYQPMLDDDLRDQTPVVLKGQILSETIHNDYRSYQVAVDRVYKGQVPVNEITVLVPGINAPGAHTIPGAPSFEPDEDTVLFLNSTETGEYQIVHLALGAFHARTDTNGNPVFVRALGDATAVDRPVPHRSAVNESPRDANEFLQWLGDTAAEAGNSVLSLASTTGVVEKDAFTFLGSTPARWWEFDSGVSVNFRANNSGQDGMTGGGFTEFQNALAAWVDDTGSDILYVYAGTNTATGGLDKPDGVNSILFNDPNNEVSGTFDCQQGGVLALGGYVTSGKTRTFEGQTFNEIIEGDIVTNDGSGCFFSGRNGSNGEEVFAHEVGHTLGLGHSCESNPSSGQNDCETATAAERDALMRSAPHADGRGAELRSDDEEGAAFLYPASTTNGGTGGGGGDTGGDDGGDGGDTGGDGGNNNGGGGGGGGGCAMSPNSGQTGLILPLLLMLSICSLVVRQRRISSTNC